MKLSVIIPTFGNAANIISVVEFMKSMEFKDFEVVVVDGAASSIISQYVNSCADINITLVSERDDGIYDAMNKGIYASKGQWLTFFGDDDRFHSKDTLNLIFSCSDVVEDFDVIYGDAEYDDGRLFFGRFDWMMIFKHTLCHQSIIYKRNVFNDAKYDSSFKLAGDYKLNLSLYKMKVRALYLHFPFSFCGSDGYSSKGLAIGYKEEFKASYNVFGFPVAFVTFLSCIFRFLKKKLF